MKLSDMYKKFCLDSAARLNNVVEFVMDGESYEKTPSFWQMDDASNVFFTRQIEYVSQITYDVKYASLKAQTLLPFTSEGGEGSLIFVYYTYNKSGKWKVISNYADDVPMTEVSGTQTSINNKDIAGAYQYNIREIAIAQQAGMPIDARKAIACRQTYEQTINKLAWFGLQGITDGGLLGAAPTNATDPVGIVNHPLVTKYTASATGTVVGGHSETATMFKNKTPAQIVADVNAWINGIRTLTNGVEDPDTVLFDVATYGYLSQTPYTAISGAGNIASISPLTILGFLKEANPGIETWDWVADLNQLQIVPSTGLAPTAYGSTSCAIVFKADENNLRFNVPMPFKQLPTEQINMVYKTNCIASVSGMIIQYPLSVAVIDGI